MKISGRTFGAAALFAGVLAGGANSAFAQNQMGQYAGQWGCEYSMQPFNGVALDTHYWQFTLALDAGGGYQMQGFYYSPSLGTQIPVQGQGSWGMTNGPRGPAIAVNGQLYRQDAGWHPFQFQVTPASNRNLYLQFRGNTHMTNIVCQR